MNNWETLLGLASGKQVRDRYDGMVNDVRGVMELYQGIIDKKVTGGLDLSWSK
jgi:hypothetical protein